ncbi:MAG TPA: hypothetical protein PKC87_02745 [Candidatus Absconditabacterales bacterium]|nr:hypothetical protein [Candidatus Absconditabacterales bacterium]
MKKEKLTEKQNEVSKINERTYEMRDEIINKIRRQIEYLVGTVYERKELNNLSPVEAVDKIIQDLSRLKKEDDFKKLNNEYIGLRKGKSTLEKNIVRIKGEIQELLTHEDISSLSIQSLFRPAVVHGINYCLTPFGHKSKEYTLGDFAKYCIENDNWASSFMKFHGIGPTDIEKIRKTFDQYNIKI